MERYELRDENRKIPLALKAAQMAVFTLMITMAPSGKIPTVVAVDVWTLFAKDSI
jgi:hypothetical protein